MTKFVIVAMLLSTVMLFSQEKNLNKIEELTTKNNFNDVQHNKGRMFLFWGWNRSNYSNSDIKFKGDDYNFTLLDVKARDRPKPFGIEFLDITKITIPQTNFRIGYFFHDHYNVSIGADHMKYVMENNTTAHITGVIGTGSDYDGVYNNDPIYLEEEFLTFENTDGLNYVNVEVNRFDTVDNWIGFPIKHIDINLTEGVGAGVLYPKTNTKLLGKERYDQFHVSGWGMSAHVGLNLTFFKYFFIQYTFKAGYINMQEIRTTKSKADVASQHFTFLENMYVFGAKFNIASGKDKKNKK